MEERMDFRILNNGSFIPSIGYGTYKTGTEGETEQFFQAEDGIRDSRK